MAGAVVQYRELAPCEALRELVAAFFSFTAPFAAPGGRAVIREVPFGRDDSFCSPLFADAQVSLVVRFEESCAPGGVWQQRLRRPEGEVIGPMTVVGSTSLEERAEMLGVYFRPGQSSPFTGVPADELVDRVVALDDLGAARLKGLPGELGDTGGVAARIDRLETVLLACLRRARASGGAVKLTSLADSVIRARGRVTVERLAGEAGVSRQHLTRVFRDGVGVTPKRFARLARFHAGLVHAGCGKRVNWAEAALELGYADQSHMIAEFREFSSLTPEELARKRWFHPFIERARVGQR